MYLMYLKIIETGQKNDICTNTFPVSSIKWSQV